MNIVGWILIVLGVLAFIGGLIIALAEQFKPQTYKFQLPNDRALDLEALAKLVGNLAKLLEQFAKLSTGIQWAILGLVAIYLGINLLG